jgi:hypothetical protein
MHTVPGILTVHDARLSMLIDKAGRRDIDDVAWEGVGNGIFRIDLTASVSCSSKT